MKRHLCCASGCYSLVDGPGQFCQAHHAQQVERDRRRIETNKRNLEALHVKWGATGMRSIYTDKRWKGPNGVRARQLAAYPFCNICGQRATQVDHIIPHQGREEYAYNMDNLQSICHSCHVAKSREEARKRKQDATHTPL